MRRRGSHRFPLYPLSPWLPCYLFRPWDWDYCCCCCWSCCNSVCFSFSLPAKSRSTTLASSGFWQSLSFYFCQISVAVWKISIWTFYNFVYLLYQVGQYSSTTLVSSLPYLVVTLPVLELSGFSRVTNQSYKHNLLSFGKHKDCINARTGHYPS